MEGQEAARTELHRLTVVVLSFLFRMDLESVKYFAKEVLVGAFPSQLS